jgi:NAD(P)H-hydrate epimerase
MKVVSATTMATLELLAYQQGYQEEDFMEKAGEGIARLTLEFIKNQQLSKQILLLCGKGNNGGDAFVAGRYLLKQGLKVTALQPELIQQKSSLGQLNKKRFLESGGVCFSELKDIHFLHYGLILDGLFGTGFKGEIQEPYASMIQAANHSRLPILAIDIPSGLNGSTGAIEGAVIHATQTIFLGLPKIGFFLKDGWNVVGKLRRLEFGLPVSLIQQAKSEFSLITPFQAAELLPSIKRNRHKYQAGQVIGLAGSPGMPGAGLMASLSALRGGSGIVRLLHPDGMQVELVGSPYELIKVPYHLERPEHVLQELEKGQATFIGPGLGKTQAVRDLLKQVVPFLQHPCVLDADALTIYSELAFPLPSRVVFTPHMGEMQTLLHQKERLILNLDLLQQCQQYANTLQITLILKGAPTFIFHPGKSIFVNPTGDPGMATAGSGDVLTGLLASLISQGLDTHETAILGVYLHGLAGEFAAERTSSYGLMATDLVLYFWQAFQFLQKVRLLH